MPKVLTAGRPWRVILSFAVPLLVGNVVQQLYQFADAIVVGRVIGVDALAAVGTTGSLIFLLLGFAWGMTSGFAIPTAQAYGARDGAAVRRSVATGAMLTGAVSIMLTVGAPFLAGPALRLLRTPAELLPQATTFAVVSFLGASTVMAFNFLAAIIRAIGDSRTPLVFLTLSCLLNVGLVITFVAGLGLGVAGAALATVVSQATSVVLCLAYVRRRVPVLHLHRDDWRVTRADLARHLRLGLPMGFQMSIIAIGALAVQVRLNSLGAEAVAAYTTAARVDGLAVALLQSLGLAVSTFVAQNYGAG
ncbi:MAG TPA: MATE family efflux transporter, partial [Cellulomonadaceae bacterium]|nr:MATE family efflux transporter [Cellulomonadaceae bacterium]